MTSVEAAGASIDDAIEDALRQLGVPRSQVEIEILGHFSKGLFGLGGRKPRVRATLRPPPASPDPVAQPSEPPVRTRAAVGTVVELTSAVLRDIVRHIGVEVEVTARPVEDHIVLELSGDSSGVLIGRRGQMLDALEYIVNRIATREGDSAPRFVVDSQRYRARRREVLEDLARRMGEQAKSKGKPVALNPMSPHDRRIVHLVLQDDATLTTKSSGKGYLRRLVIIPEGAGSAARSQRQ